MRTWRWIGPAGFLLATLVSSGGAWGMSFDDMKTEMETAPTPEWGCLVVMRAPMVGSGATYIPITDLCVSGGVLRPIGRGAPNIEMGTVRPGNQYSVPVFRRNDTGDEIFQYERNVSLPDCN